MKTAIHAMTFGIEAAADVAEKRFVDYTGTPCAAAGKALGVSHSGGADTGEQCPLALGIVLVEAGGAISAGADVESDADGKAVAYSTGEVNGTALDAATAEGDIIRVKNI